MSWQLFRWTWQLQSPLFVGSPPAGALNRCRLYVPARAVWGAVTAELARLEGSDDQKYLPVGNELRQHARFSYLYPAESHGKHWLAWLPEYREGDGLVWVREDDANGAIADRRFRRRLLWTRPGTAIDPDNDAALDGSLRETECIQPHWRHDDNSCGNAVGMVGYVFLRNGKDLAERLRAVTTLFVGGDTRYGLGRLERVTMEPAEKFFAATVALDGEEPQVFTQRALGHVSELNGVRICGELEAIGGWDMTSQLQDRSINGPVWTPGSQIDGKDQNRFRIGQDGLWHFEEKNASSPSSKGASSS